MRQDEEAIVVQLSPGDVDAIEELRAENNETLGFLPKPVMEEYLRRGGGLGVRGANGIVAYCLYARQRHHLRIIHLCVAHAVRGAGHARRLVNAVVEAAKGHGLGVVKLSCRRDFPANAMWRSLGFVPLDRKAAKTLGEWLTIWYRDVPGAAQQDIFATVASDDRVNVVIDAQLLFQIHGRDHDIAKGLQADFLRDLLVLHIADETFHEIERAGQEDRRKRSGHLALSFPRVRYDVDRMLAVEQELRRVLPSSTESQRSDIRQIAMTAASDVRIFLTRDERLIGNATAIKHLAAVDVLHPYKLIVRLDEFTNRESYNPKPLSGVDLSWRKLREADTSRQLVRRLLGPHEKKGNLKGRFDAVLSRPQTWRTEALWVSGTIAAFRSTKPDQEHGRLVVGLCRALQGFDRSLFADYAIASVLREAVRQGYDSVLIEPDGTTPETAEKLPQLGFAATENGFIGDCPATVMSASELRAKVHPRHCDASLRELERACSPVALRDGELEVLMVPIKPGYARSLFDTELAAGDMFGADSDVLLRLENVYFRKKSQHRLIQAPARILWYESDGAGIVATSHLDGVRIGSPKDMFREHRRLGTLSWPDIWAMCHGDELQEIMVLKFSRSYMFRSPVDLRSLREIYRNRSKKSCSPVAFASAKRDIARHLPSWLPCR